MQNDIGNRLKFLIEQLNISYKEFSKITGIPYPTLQDYIGGKRIPGGENLQKISMQLHVNLNWLLTGEGEMFQSPPIKEALKMAMIPVIGRVPAGFPDLVSEEIIEYIKVPEAEANTYALIVKGDSMSPLIKDGDYVTFLSNGEIKNGDIVVVNNEFGETMVKKYYIKDDRIILASINPEYPSFTPNEHWRIIGRVTSIIRVTKL